MALAGLLFLGGGLASYDWRLALVVVGCVLLALAVGGALSGPRR